MKISVSCDELDCNNYIHEYECDLIPVVGDYLVFDGGCMKEMIVEARFIHHVEESSGWERHVSLDCRLANAA